MLKDLLDSDGFNSLAKTRDGWLLYNKNDQYVGASIGKYGEFSQAEMELFQQILAEGNYVVEVGANIGSHTLGISKCVGVSGKVFAYEPQRIIFQMLCANMAINSRTNVHCYEQAVSNVKGILSLPDIDYSQQENFGGMAVSDNTEGNSVEVVVLDEVLKDIPRLDFMKVDAEGMEHEVINGAKKLISQYKPVLYVENDRKEKSQALIELIQSMQYRLYWHFPKLYNPNNYANDKDNIFGDTASLNMLCLRNDREQDLQGFTEIINSSDYPVTKAVTT